MKRRNLLLLLALVALTACTKRADEILYGTKKPATGSQADLTLPSTPAASVRREQWRPQIHYTPAQGWINDPNGLVLSDGVWHLYYQYNPMGNTWGNMSWGHATSPDLFHWTEQPVALLPDELGYIYSGSAVVDADNTAGFGAGAIVAAYTAHGAHEQQCIAYSLDGGRTFTKYEGNPVIRNTAHADYRDPKVFWDDELGHWYMVLALGGEHAVEIWRSDDLKAWRRCSTFHAASYGGCNQGVWECPDLFPVTYGGERRYVLTVNVSGGCPNGGGSGTMYFVGRFSGTTFQLDRYDYPFWLDQGMDDYASVTWNGTPDRLVCIGWMNNQLYSGNYPPTVWKSHMTLPRQMMLDEYEGRPLLKTIIAPEVEGIAGPWAEAHHALGQMDAYQLQVPLTLDAPCTITLSNASGNAYEVRLDAAQRRLIIDRGARTGAYTAREFPLTNICCPLLTEQDEVTLNIYVDQSAVELTTDDGSMIASTLVYPTTIYDRLTVEGQAVQARVRPLRRVW